MWTTDNYVRIFSLLVRLCILQLFYCSFVYCTCIKQLFKASLNGAMKIKIKLKTTGFSFFFSNSIENTKVVNNFVQYRVVWLHHKQYKFWIYEQICRTLIFLFLCSRSESKKTNRKHVSYVSVVFTFKKNRSTKIMASFKEIELISKY